MFSVLFLGGGGGVDSYIFNLGKMKISNLTYVKADLTDNSYHWLEKHSEKL